MAEPRKGAPVLSPGFLLWHVELRWQSAMIEALAPVGLTHVQFALLAAVMWLTEEQDLDATQSMVAEHAGTDPTMTSQVLRALEARKLIARRPGREDRRERIVTPLAAGRALFMRALGIVRTVDGSFFDAALSNPSAFREELVRLGTAAGMPASLTIGRSRRPRDV